MIKYLKLFESTALSGGIITDYLISRKYYTRVVICEIVPGKVNNRRVNVD